MGGGGWGGGGGGVGGGSDIFWRKWVWAWFGSVSGLPYSDRSPGEKVFFFLFGESESGAEDEETVSTLPPPPPRNPPSRNERTLSQRALRTTEGGPGPWNTHPQSHPPPRKPNARPPPQLPSQPPATSKPATLESLLKVNTPKAPPGPSQGPQVSLSDLSPPRPDTSSSYSLNPIPRVTLIFEGLGENINKKKPRP